MIFSRSFGTSMIFFFYKITPVLLQGAVWGYVALCDSSSFWYGGTSYLYKPAGSKVKVKYRGHISQKMAISRVKLYIHGKTPNNGNKSNKGEFIK